MARAFAINTTGIASGGTLSGVFPIMGARALGIIAPSLTNCNLQIQVAQSSAGPFVPLYFLGGQSLWQWNIGSAQAALSVADAVPFSHGKLAASVAQAAPVTFSIIQRL